MAVGRATKYTNIFKPKVHCFSNWVIDWVIDDRSLVVGHGLFRRFSRKKSDEVIKRNCPTPPTVLTILMFCENVLGK